jgi:hypothetical protein
MRPSRCQYCGGLVRSPHALDGHMLAKHQKSKLFVQRRNYMSRCEWPKQNRNLLLTIY